MKTAILFWFYKDVELCVERLKRLRSSNPHLQIFGLYGGNLLEAENFMVRLSPWMDHFYAFPQQCTSDWKWRKGDQLIAAWYQEFGRQLDWDSIFIAQWDLIMLKPLDKLLPTLKPDELVLPGLRPLKEVESWWWWVREGSSERFEYEAFRQHLELTDAFPADPLCCNFMTAVLPRRFLEQYAAIFAPSLGFLEYKIPIYAQGWGFAFNRDHPFHPVWEGERAINRVERYLRTFHAGTKPIPAATFAFNALSPFGAKVFHPCTEKRRDIWKVPISFKRTCREPTSPASLVQKTAAS